MHVVYSRTCRNESVYQWQALRLPWLPEGVFKLRQGRMDLVKAVPSLVEPDYYLHQVYVNYCTQQLYLNVLALPAPSMANKEFNAQIWLIPHKFHGSKCLKYTIQHFKHTGCFFLYGCYFSYIMQVMSTTKFVVVRIFFGKEWA
jgi:hypothetical protein